MKRKTMIKGFVFALASAVIYGCMPLMAKNIYLQGVNPLTLVLLRNLLALPFLALAALRQHKSLRVPVKALPQIGLIALVGCSVTPVLLFSSYQYIDSGTATVLHFIYPAVVVIAGMLFFKQKMHKDSLLCVVLCVVGILLFFSPDQNLNFAGTFYALSSGITCAAYVLLLSRFRYKEINGFLFSFYVAAFSSVFMLFGCLLSGQLALPVSALGWVLCVIFAVAVTVGAVFLFQQSIFIIGGPKASVLSTLEPITSVFVGVLVFHEQIALREIIGSVLVISAAFLIAYFDLRRHNGETSATE